MAVLIVDTNLWVTASGRSAMSCECARDVLSFVANFQNNDDRLAVDHKWKILGEYYDRLDPQDPAYEILALLAKENRFDWTQIEIDSDGNANVPPACAIHDPSDRKFVAVALAHEARPPIHNASDTDWLEDEAMLANCGVSHSPLRSRAAPKIHRETERSWSSDLTDMPSRVRIRAF